MDKENREVLHICIFQKKMKITVIVVCILYKIEILFRKKFHCQVIIFDRERLGYFIEHEVFLALFLMVKPENL